MSTTTNKKINKPIEQYKKTIKNLRHKNDMLVEKNDHLQKITDLLKDNIDDLRKSNKCENEPKKIMSEFHQDTFYLDSVPKTSSIYLIGPDKEKRFAMICKILDDHIGKSSKTAILIMSQHNSLKYKKMYPNADVKDHFDDEFIEKYFDNWCDEKMYNTKYCVIFDDCIDEKINKENENLMELLDAGRKCNTKIIISSNKCCTYTGIDIIKKNINHIFLLKNIDVDTQQQLFEDYTNFFQSFDIFQNAYNLSTKYNGCMVIDTKIYEHNIEDYIFEFDNKNYPIKCNKSNDRDSDDDDSDDVNDNNGNGHINLDNEDASE